MANRMFYPLRGSLSREVVRLYGSVTIGTSGAIASQSCKGFSVAQTDSEDGRYTVTLDDPYNGFLGCNLTIEAADDAAVPVVYAGVRNVDVSAGSKTFDVQVTGIDTGAFADTDPASGDVLHLEIILQNGADV